MSAAAGERKPVHVEARPGGNPWAGVLVLAVVNLLPLAFVLRGSLELPLLVVCYLVEAVLLTLLTPRSPRPGRDGRQEPRWSVLGGSMAFALVLVLFGGTAIAAVDWDGGAALVLGVTVLLFVLGARTADRGTRAGGEGWIASWLWHLVVIFVGALVAVPYMQDLAQLGAADWRPTPLGDYWMAEGGVQVNRAMLASGLAPEVLGTAIFVLFKTVNEVLMATRRAVLATRRQA